MTQMNADFEGMNFFGQSVIIPEVSGINLVKAVKRNLNRFPVDFMISCHIKRLIICLLVLFQVVFEY